MEARVADFLLMGLGATLASPIAWEHHYGILFPIFVCMWLILWFGKNPLQNIWVKIAFVTCYLVAANVFPFVKFTAFSYLNILQSYLFFAACGVFILLLLIKHQPNPKSSTWYSLFKNKSAPRLGLTCFCLRSSYCFLRYYSFVIQLVPEKVNVFSHTTIPIFILIFYFIDGRHDRRMIATA